MASKLRSFSTETLETRQMGQAVDEIMMSSTDERRAFERRWYDNNFFDDGHHFRYLSRIQNKIVDLSRRSNMFAPMRAIPKASRQIRGVANLLTQADPVPVVYPEKVNKEAFKEAGEGELEKAIEESKRIARLSGHWLTEEFKSHNLTEQLALMTILTAKHGVSYMQIWPDAVKEKIKTSVLDAFDIYTVATVNRLEDEPYIIKTAKMFISEIKANEEFDKKQVEKIHPDNRHASSEIKDAYMGARFGRMSRSDRAATLMLKEAYLKEHISPENKPRIKKQDNGAEILQNRKDGDPIIRQVFVAGNIWLKDTYLDMSTYPFVDFRMEPGPMYPVPLIERFIPVNKSLDLVLSRVERYLHTMVVGTWIKRQGEQLNLSNQAGGQIIEYKQSPPVQGNIAPMPNFVFNFIQILESLIEEQGVTTSTLGKLPKGVKANAAIETLKESEAANLIIASRQLTNTVKRIAEKFLDIADDFFVTPQSFSFLEKGEPQYVDIIGKRALKKREELKVPVENPDVVPISKEYRVEIETQPSIAYTREGKKSAMKELVQELRAYVAEGIIPGEVVQTVMEPYLESYGFGATQDFMEALEKNKGGISMTEQQLQAIKIAVAEVIKDTGLADPEQRVKESQVGAAQAIKDTGIADKEGETEGKPPSKSIPFKDLPAPRTGSSGKTSRD